MAGKKQSGPFGGGSRGGERRVQQLLQTAFQPTGATDEFRQRLIRTSLGILGELARRGGAAADETTISGARGNSMKSVLGEVFRRSESSERRANAIPRDQASDSGEEEDALVEALQRRRSQGLRRR